MIIIGIDPGSIICGYGVIETNGSKFSLVEYGVVHAKKKNESMPLRLKEIYTRLNSVVERTLPDFSAFESMYYSKNVQSLMKLSHARSAAMLSMVMREIPIVEYAPTEVKKAVTGKGAASKEQVQYMVKSILGIDETPEFFDATDALAVAICHGLRKDLNSESSGSWSDFIKKNPGRIARI